MVTWSEILSECDDADQGYRQRIVTIFRKYEGQTTDERDGSNRVVVVTAASFARHLGMATQTFADWVNPPLPSEVVTDTVITSSEVTTIFDPPVVAPTQQPDHLVPSAEVRPAPTVDPGPLPWSSLSSQPPAHDSDGLHRMGGVEPTRGEQLAATPEQGPGATHPTSSILTFEDRVLAADNAIISVIEFVQENKQFNSESLAVAIHQLEGTLEMLKSVIRSSGKEISIEDFLQ